MLKKLIYSVLLISLLTGCTTYYVKDECIKEDLYLKIESINIDEEIKIESIKKNVNKIVMFYEYGRPNIDKSNTIIGAHSGYGYNAYFNNLNELKEGDLICIYYECETYKYEVNKIYEVYETNVSVLENDEKSKLTLMTCKIGERNKRIIVEAYLIP